MSTNPTAPLTKVLRTLVLATATPFTIYSLGPPTPDRQPEATPRHETPRPVKNMASAPGGSTTNTSFYDTVLAFRDFLDASGIPWTIMGGSLIAAVVFGARALRSKLERLYYGRYVEDVDGGDGGAGELTSN